MTDPTLPRDAATLVLVRREDDSLQVLMGRRPSSSEFVPDAYVFPGGKVEPQDSRVHSEFGLESQVEKLLMARCGDSARSARALAYAAVRETYEETGLLVARPGSFTAPPSDSWRDFQTKGLAPDLTPLRFIGRAITPSLSPIRFHARFLVADASCARGELRESSELEDTRWFTFAEAKQLSMLDVTRLLLDHAEEWSDRGTTGHAKSVLFVRYRGESLMVRHESARPEARGGKSGRRP
jgi:8-oxo-dGTP pyrophosphatase MutT (NUDIX family)